MKEKPILFSGEMVRAILDGRKTQTRRVMKIQPKYSDCVLSRLADTTDRERTKHIDKLHWVRLSDDRFNVVYDDNRYFRCPYGQSGDRLWVREKWSHRIAENGIRLIGYHADDSARAVLIDWAEDDVGTEATDLRPWNLGAVKWKPSIHMPRWASRINLLIKDVRVERINKISKEDAKAEGVESLSAFKGLWESINGGDSWHQNPWVWVVEFERVKGEK